MTATETTLLHAAHAVDADTVTDDGWILIDGDTIRAVGSGPQAPAADRSVDLGDATLVPGFIDLHGHGGAHGAYDNSADEIHAALAMHRRHGTTRTVLSLVANTIDTLARSLDTIRAVMAEDPLVLGAHLEGPFLSAYNHGAHEPGFLLDPSREHVNALLAAGSGVLRQVTIAPELDGALEAVRHIAANGVIAAVGHTAATADVAAAAFEAGATILTHAFHAMPGIHHRQPGPIMAAVADEGSPRRPASPSSATSEGSIPNCPLIRTSAPRRVSGSRHASTGSRTARSRNSSGYFLRAPMTLIIPLSESVHQTRGGTALGVGRSSAVDRG